MVSTGVKSILAPRQCHDSVGAERLACVTAQARETDRPLLPTNLDEDAAAVRRSLEIDRVVRFDAEQIADGLRDFDLPFACNTQFQSGITLARRRLGVS